MNIKHKGKIVAVAVAVTGTLLPLGAAQTATGAAPLSERTVRAHLDGAPSTVLADGSVLTQKGSQGHVVGQVRWANGATIKTSGPEGSTLVGTFTSDPAGHKAGAVGDPGTADVSIQTPDPKLSGIDPQVQINARKNSGRSVVTDAMETGMTFEDAVRTFGDLGDAIPTKAHALAVVNGTYAAPTVAQSSFPSALALPSLTPQITAVPAIIQTAATPVILDSACVDFTGGPANHATSHGCNIRYLDYSVSGDWYISNKMKSSAEVSDWYYQMVRHDVYTNYNVGNSWVDWEPSAVYPKGACGTLTLGVQDPKTGANISYGTTICPSSLGPVWASSAHLGFGGIWSGGSTVYQNALALGVVHNPPGKSAAYSVHVWVQWG
jgi:hypothetical protein